jgi:outer membrane protein TolC
VLAKIQASEDLQRERMQQVRYGSTLEADLIESRAHALQARHELVTTEVQRSDLQMQLNDIIGLPPSNARFCSTRTYRRRPSDASANPAFARRWSPIL